MSKQILVWERVRDSLRGRSKMKRIKVVINLNKDLKSPIKMRRLKKKKEMKKSDRLWQSQKS